MELVAKKTHINIPTGVRSVSESFFVVKGTVLLYDARLNSDLEGPVRLGSTAAETNIKVRYRYPGFMLKNLNA